MRRLLFLAASAAILCALGASIPDTVTKDKVTYARRGSLGADSYVATNVVVDPPGYQLSRVADMKLRDRAVNFAAVEGTNAVFALPGRKSAAGYARARRSCTRPTGTDTRRSRRASGCSRSSSWRTTSISWRRGNSKG